MKDAGLAITVTDTFRHVGVMTSGARDLASVCLTEPHNVLEQPIDTHLPHMVRETDDAAARKLCDDIRALMLRSYEVLKDHPVNLRRESLGLLPADMIWPWGAATAVRLPSFREKYGHWGTVVSAVPLVWGIAGLAGLKTPHVEGANRRPGYQLRGQGALRSGCAGRRAMISPPCTSRPRTRWPTRATWAASWRPFRMWKAAWSRPS